MSTLTRASFSSEIDKDGNFVVYGKLALPLKDIDVDKLTAENLLDFHNKMVDGTYEMDDELVDSLKVVLKAYLPQNQYDRIK